MPKTELAQLRRSSKTSPTQGEMALRLKVARGSLSSFESGRGTYSQMFVGAYARLLGESELKVTILRLRAVERRVLNELEAVREQIRLAERQGVLPAASSSKADRYTVSRSPAALRGIRRSKPRR